MKKLFFIFLIITLLFSCQNTKNNNDSFMVNIYYNELCQEIDGFGGSNAWTSLPPNAAAAANIVKLLYSKTEGAGFTILRNRIPFRERLSGDDNPSLNDGFIIRKNDNAYDYTLNEDGTKTFFLNWNAWDISSTRNLINQIKALGDNGPEKLVVMSTPWTPPNNRVTQWKENVEGVSAELDYEINWSKPEIWGRLKRDKYEDYADLLADYVKNFYERMGAPLSILSIQNEPNWKVEYESAYWNGEDIRDFIKIIGRRFPMKGINDIGIMAPEFENYNIDFNAMIKPMLNDPESNKVLSHIALHQYNAGYDPSRRTGARVFQEVLESGKRFWQTEISTSGPFAPEGTGIENALYFARMIHHNMTLVQTNAFLYWWLWTNDSYDIKGSLINYDNNEVEAALRLYTMGQYSRFIRPGWYRIDCDTSPAFGIYTSAYRNPGSDEITIVAINERPVSVSVTLNLHNANFKRLDIWQTSSEEKLTPLGMQRVSRNSAKINLPPMSVTTLYGACRGL